MPSHWHHDSKHFFKSEREKILSHFLNVVIMYSHIKNLYPALSYKIIQSG